MSFTSSNNTLATDFDKLLIIRAKLLLFFLMSNLNMSNLKFQVSNYTKMNKFTDYLYFFYITLTLALGSYDCCDKLSQT